MILILNRYKDTSIIDYKLLCLCCTPLIHNMYIILVCIYVEFVLNITN